MNSNLFPSLPCRKPVKLAILISLIALGIAVFALVQSSQYMDYDKAETLVGEMRQLDADIREHELKVERLYNSADNVQENCVAGIQVPYSCETAWERYKEANQERKKLQPLYNQWNDKNHEWQKILTGMG